MCVGRQRLLTVSYYAYLLTCLLAFSKSAKGRESPHKIYGINIYNVIMQT